MTILFWVTFMLILFMFSNYLNDSTLELLNYLLIHFYEDLTMLLLMFTFLFLYFTLNYLLIYFLSSLQFSSDDLVFIWSYLPVLIYLVILIYSLCPNFLLEPDSSLYYIISHFSSLICLMDTAESDDYCAMEAFKDSSFVKDHLSGKPMFCIDGDKYASSVVVLKKWSPYTCPPQDRIVTFDTDPFLIKGDRTSSWTKVEPMFYYMNKSPQPLDNFTHHFEYIGRLASAPLDDTYVCCRFDWSSSEGVFKISLMDWSQTPVYNSNDRSFHNKLPLYPTQK